MAIKKGLGKFGSRFFFELFVETMQEPIIQGLRKYLGSIKAEDIPGMVRESRFPPVEHLDFSAVGDNVEHIEKISLLRMMEFIAEARPDLAVEIQNMGDDAGAEYMAKLRTHLLNKLRQSAGEKEFKPKEDIAMAHCDVCGGKWPVTKEEATAMAVCPFCGAGGDEEKKTPSEDE